MDAYWQGCIPDAGARAWVVCREIPRLGGRRPGAIPAHSRKCGSGSQSGNEIRFVGEALFEVERRTTCLFKPCPDNSKIAGNKEAIQGLAFRLDSVREHCRWLPAAHPVKFGTAYLITVSIR